MGTDMTRIDLPYVQTFKTRHGKTVSYYRRQGRQQRLHGEIGSAVWLANYQRIHEQHEEGAPRTKSHADGTWGALISTYRQAPEFLELSDRTRADYNKHLDAIVAANGEKTVAGMTRPALLSIRDKVARKSSARQADYLIAIYNVLLTFAVDRGVRKDHPGRRIKKVYRAIGHRPWMDSEIDDFCKRWPLGTWERTAFEFLLNIAQRRGDTAKVAWPQISGGWIRVRQGKTGEFLQIPMSNRLSEALDAWPRKGVAILIGDKGKPVGYDRFGHRMAQAFDDAGLVGVTIHGLRYTTATILKELGVDLETRQALLGHRTVAMAEKYSRQKRGAQAAVEAMDSAASVKPTGKSVKPTGGGGAK